MGPYPSFSSYHRLRSTHTESLGCRFPKLNCKWPQVIFRAFCLRPICQDKSAVFPTRRRPKTVADINEYQSNRAMNRNGRKRSSNKTQGSSRHDAWRRRLLCIYQFCTVKFFEHMRMRQNTSQQRNFWLKRDWNVRDLRMIICPRRQFLTRKILIRLKTNKCLSEKLTEIYEKQAKRMRHYTYTISCL